MVTILVVFHSQSGRAKSMAEAVASGVESIENAKVRLLHATDATLDDLLTCDGLAIGSPEYFGYMAGLVKDFFDRTYEAARGRREVLKKPYVVFISAGNDGRGALSHIERICSGYPFKKVHEAVIARGDIDDEVLDQCRDLGKTIAAGCEIGIY